MGNELVAVENALEQYRERFIEVLPPTLPVKRLQQTVMIACERTPDLVFCSVQSIVNAAMTAAVLGLEVDGVSGQGYILPFKRTAQFVIGYKGYPTIAARSGMTINSGVIREGDEYDYQEGTEGFVRIKRSLEGRQGRKILAAWATCEAVGRPAIVKVVAYEDILETMRRAPGSKRSDSPWNDHVGSGHEQMCTKTAVRKLGAMVPIVAFQMATVIDGAVEGGHSAYLRPDGLPVVDGEAAHQHQPSPYPDRKPAVTDIEIEPRTRAEPTRTANEILAELRLMSKEQAEQWARDNAAKLEALAAGNPQQRQAHAAMTAIIRDKLA